MIYIYIYLKGGYIIVGKNGNGSEYWIVECTTLKSRRRSNFRDKAFSTTQRKLSGLSISVFVDVGRVPSVDTFQGEENEFVIIDVVVAHQRGQESAGEQGVNIDLDESLERMQSTNKI